MSISSRDLNWDLLPADRGLSASPPRVSPWLKRLPLPANFANPPQGPVREENDPLQQIFQASPEWVSILDLDGRILFINETGRETLALEEGTSGSAASWLDIWAGDSREKACAAIRSAAIGTAARFTERRIAADGTTGWWDVGLSKIPASSEVPSRIVVLARDISAQKLAEEGLHWAATHDCLTLLPNRALFQTQIEDEISNARAAKSPFGLLLLDLDEFKRVNDSLGHDTGDALLCELAARLRSVTREVDFVARLGGDEFAIILRNLEDEQHLSRAASAILERLKEPCIRNGRTLDCHASIGASIFPQHGRNKLELMKAADTALYAAKDAGRRTFRMFSASMRSDLQLKHSMLSLANDALAEHRVMPFYQPKVDLRTGCLQGFEALLRWEHPTKGTQTPDTVQAAFHDERLAIAIGDRMIDLVTRDMRRWIDSKLPFGHVAINASSADFRRGGFAEYLLDKLKAAGVPPTFLQLEVTETVFLDGAGEEVGQALKKLDSAGIQIALDDFGTGYASLSHLKQFPVSIIKIDKSFIRDLHEDADDEVIVRAVISLGQSLNMKVVAEGVETPAQSAYLRKYSCDYGQGYLFGRAEAADAIPALVKTLAREGWSDWHNIQNLKGAADTDPPPAMTTQPVDRPNAKPRTPPQVVEKVGSARNVYIVDDDREIRDSTQFLLEKMGYHCRTFASGSAFLSAFLQLAPGCVLLDMRMDGLNGQQVLSELQWMHKAWAVIIMSGHVDEAMANSAKASGAHAVLGKPFDDALLSTALESVFLKLGRGFVPEAALNFSRRKSRAPVSRLRASSSDRKASR